MKEIIKSLGKRKIFYILIVLQFSLSMEYFFASAVAIQSTFYINISVPRELDISTEQIVHLEVQVDTDAEDFYKFTENIEGNIVESVGTYQNNFFYSEELGEDIGSTEVDSGIDAIMNIEIKEGTYFDDSDFVYNETAGKMENPISILVGSDLASRCNIKPGSIIRDDTDIYYKVKGIMKPGTNWFFQTISEGMILTLDNQIILPRNEEYDTRLHYYCVLPENADKEKAIIKISQAADMNNITLKATLLSEELNVTFENNLNENKYWMIFAIVILVMISVGTSILFVAQMDSRKYDIGIRLSVGYSVKKIMRLLIGEIIMVGTAAFIVATVIGKVTMGEEAEYFNGAAYSYGHYISTEIILLGILVMFVMCMPAVVVLWIKAKRLQPRELIGGNE